MHRRTMRTAAFLAAVLALALAASGCARNTIENRRQERYGAYTSLPQETRQMVDAGQIKVGMPMDAVYIAWGKPSQIISSETEEGLTTTWIYQDTRLQPYYYWTYRYYNRGRHSYPEPYYAHDYLVQAYISAEVVFDQGVVKSWRTLPSPAGY